jgi:hypothetical protein
MTSLAFHYDTDLFDAAFIQQWADQFANLVAAVIHDPQQQVSKLRTLLAV